MIQFYYVSCILLQMMPNIVYSKSENFTTSRSEHSKQLGVFTVVKFPNDLCVSATTGRNGTCYTSSECAAKGGSSSGSCASSFGVCCIFEKTCGGGSVAENCTYFTSAARSAGSSCTLTICKCSSDVCQLKLEFETFSLSAPYTSTAGAAAADQNFLTNIGTCQTDFFSVSVPGGKAPPMICGENSGYHMYVPASSTCNVLSSFFGSSTTATTSAFTIKITQIKCNAKNKAPEGCLQYLTASSGSFSTYNYNSGNGPHLANQDYCYCIRAERTACTICYSALSPGLGIGRGGTQLLDTWCGYEAGVSIGGATADTDWSSFDHVVIPNSQCPVTTAAGTAIPSVDRYCGTTFSCAVAPVSNPTTAASNTVCTSTKPFQFCVKTNGQENYNADAGATNDENTAGGSKGFQMSYFQSSSCLLKGGADA